MKYNNSSKQTTKVNKKFKEIHVVIKRRRIIAALILAFAVIISVFFVGYARHIKRGSDIEIYKLESQISELQTMVDNCKEK